MYLRVSLILISALFFQVKSLNFDFSAYFHLCLGQKYSAGLKSSKKEEQYFFLKRLTAEQHVFLVFISQITKSSKNPRKKQIISESSKKSVAI